MRHLSAEQLVDLAEGIEADASASHLRSCPACQRELSDLRTTMAVAATLDAPEPSPLFWERLSARVHDAVQSESHAGGGVWHALRIAGARLAGYSLPDKLIAIPTVWHGSRIAAIGGLATVVAVLALLFQVSRPLPMPSSAPVSAVVELAGEGMPPVDDASLSLVADLVVGLDWETAREAGLTTHIGVDDDAVNQLTSGERRELRRLLQGELSSSRRGGA